MICQVNCKAQTFDPKTEQWTVNRDTMYINAKNQKHALKKAISAMKKKFSNHQEIEAVIVP